MKSSAIETRAICEFAREITSLGPHAVPFDGLRVLQHKPRLRSFLAARVNDIIPVTVELWPSLSCNARCPTCPYRLSDARDIADKTSDLFLFSLRDAKRILYELLLSGVNSVIFTGGGEPLLHPQLFEIVEYTRSIGLRWALFTNGLSFTPEKAKMLFSAKPDFLRISLDAGNPETYRHVYSVPAEQFCVVVQNAIEAAKIAASSKFAGFGLSFTLEPSITDSELKSIASLIMRIANESAGGISFAAFRPRVIHYRGSEPICPQRYAGRYEDLADRIDALVGNVVRTATSDKLVVDVKRGLFVSADAISPRATSISSSWQTNIDHRGVGYGTAEMAGSTADDFVWGALSPSMSFLDSWHSAKRHQVYQRLASGLLQVPVVHRTLPVDSFLQALSTRVSLPLEDGLIDQVIDALMDSPFYRTRNPYFV